MFCGVRAELERAELSKTLTEQTRNPNLDLSAGTTNVHKVCLQMATFTHSKNRSSLDILAFGTTSESGMTPNESS